MKDKFADKYVLVDGLRAPAEIVGLAIKYGYKKAVSIYEVLALYKNIAPSTMQDFMLNPEKMEKTAAGLCARFKKTPEEMKADLNFAAVMFFCGPSCIWSSMQIICDLASSVNGHMLGPKRTSE